ncbi:MAG: TIGR01777 family protein [Myxococcaceae bacterium]|nr:TIGR01777 family protein [Myxococcaceae bacterium]
MRIAISGGTGFLGRPLVQRLSAAGHECLVLTRHPLAQRSLPHGATPVEFVAGRPLPAERIAGAEAVIHLAGETVGVRWNDEVKRRIRDSRVQGTLELAKAAREAGTVRHFISASAVGFYGNDRGAEALTEESAPGHDFLAEVCREWEAAARTAAEGSDRIRVVTPRIGVVLHPEGGALRQMLTPIKLGVGGRLGTGAQYVSWIHREDLLGLFVFLLEAKDLHGPINATAPKPVTNAELTRAIARKLRRPAIVPVPSLALRALFGEMAENLLGGQRVIPQRAQEAGFTFRFPTLAAALDDLLG